MTQELAIKCGGLLEPHNDFQEKSKFHFRKLSFSTKNAIFTTYSLKMLFLIYNIKIIILLSN